MVNSINSKLHIKKISKEGAKDISKLTPEYRDNVIKEAGNNIGKIMFPKLNIE